jgi:C4-type Zn-finger protein
MHREISMRYLFCTVCNYKRSEAIVIDTHQQERAKYIMIHAENGNQSK